jgi:DNA-binding CsgD family transcriptional regulator
MTEFTSGRRRYLSRAYCLDSKPAGGSRLRPTVVVLLERKVEKSLDFTWWSEEFQLTNRERETVGFLLKGLTSKQIAKEMSISAHTVKAFLRLVMIKVGATNRTGIIARILNRAS